MTERPAPADGARAAPAERSRATPGPASSSPRPRNSPSTDTRPPRCARSLDGPASTPRSCTTTSTDKQASSPRSSRFRCVPTGSWGRRSRADRAARRTARARGARPRGTRRPFGPRPSRHCARRSVRARSPECSASSFAARSCIASPTRLDDDDAELRAELAASQLVGVIMVRYVLEFEPVASLPSRTSSRGSARRCNGTSPGSRRSRLVLTARSAPAKNSAHDE